MISLVVKAEKPYGHTAYTRTDPRTGKIEQVQARGVKPQLVEAPRERASGAKEATTEVLENIKPEHKLKIYHGTSLAYIRDLVNGFDANTVHHRHYGGPRHAGLFITPSEKTADRFASYGEIVVELEVKAKHLHGVDYSGNIGRKQEMASSTREDLAERYPNSFRPYLTMTMTQTNEPQGLLRGLVKPSQIKRIKYTPYGESEGKWYTREKFLSLGLKTKGTDPYGPENPIEDIKFDLSSPKHSIDDFYAHVASQHNLTLDRVKTTFEHRAKRGEDALLEVLEQFDLGTTARSALAAKILRSIGVKKSLVVKAKIKGQPGLYFDKISHRWKKVNKYLFHTTGHHKMDEIKSGGLKPRSGAGTFNHGVYGAHSQGKVFLASDWDAGETWASKVQELLDHASDHTHEQIPVTLRAGHRKTKLDKVGNKDVDGSRYTTENIPPEDLEFYHPKHGWRPVAHWGDDTGIEHGISDTDEHGHTTHLAGDGGYTPTSEEDAHAYSATTHHYHADRKRRADKAKAKREEAERVGTLAKLKHQQEWESTLKKEQGKWSGAKREAKIKELSQKERPSPIPGHRMTALDTSVEVGDHSFRWKDILRVTDEDIPKKAEPKSDNSDKVWESAVEIFGTTTDPSEAGYILPDGKMLDFSQKKEGGSPGQRSDDHRSIRRAFTHSKTEVGGEYSDALIEAVNRGAIRLSYNPRKTYASMSIESSGVLSSAQKRVLTKLVRGVDDLAIDIADKKGDKTHSTYLEGRITSRQVFDFFDKRPSGTEVVKAMLAVKAKKSLLTEDPHRKKDYAHITHTHGGKRGRAKHHKANGPYSAADWFSDTHSKLMEYANDSMEAGHESPEQWLQDRGIRLPDHDDVATRRTINQWLCTYGHNMFTLGMHVTDASGKTIASPQELPRLQKSLVVRVDLEKGRLRGAKGREKLKKLTWGAIEFPGSTKETKYLEAKDVGREQEIILKIQQKDGVTGVHHPPTVKTDEYKKQLASYRRKVGRAQKKLHGALEQRKAPSPEAVNIKDVEVKLEAQRKGDVESVSMIDILFKRVQEWEPTKRRKKVDPLFVEERKKLLARKRELSNKLKLGRVSDKAKAAASKNYKEVMSALNRMQTEYHVAMGGGLTKFGEKEFKLVEHGIVDEDGKKVPYKDIGFDPYTKPMSYLLSMTDWRKDKKGALIFSKRERDALDHEYRGMISKAVSKIAGAYRLHETTQGGARIKTDEVKDLEQLAELTFAQMTNDWDRHAKGVVGTGNNFARYMYGLYAGRLRDAFVKERKHHGKEVHAEDEGSMPEMSGGRTMTPGVRIESQTDALRRRGLNKWVGEIFAKLLDDPVQQAILESRLNIYKEQEEGVSEEKLSWPTDVRKYGRRYSEPKRKQGDPPPKKQEEVEEEAGFAMKPWTQVKKDVLERLDKLKISDMAKEKQRKMLKRMSAGEMNRMYFKPALESLRSREYGLSHKERGVLAEFAALNRKYLQGLRHETWDPSEAVGKLKVKREKTPQSKRGRSRRRDPEGFLAGRKSKLKRSLVIPDYIGAISALIDECMIWDLNGV